MKEIKIIKKYIIENYGKKCSDYSVVCPTCIAHKILEDLEQIIEI